jgi:hypothetical protein
MEEMEDLLKYLKTRETLLKQGLHVSDEAPGEKRTSALEANAKQDQMDRLLKEMRELIELLKSEKQGKKAPESN